MISSSRFASIHRMNLREACGAPDRGAYGDYDVLGGRPERRGSGARGSARFEVTRVIASERGRNARSIAARRLL